MRAALNDGLRFAIGVVLRSAGAIAEALHRIRVRNQERLRSRLALRLGVRPETALSTEPPPIEPAADIRPDPTIGVARTSGTSGDPKIVAYPRQRITAVKRVFIDAFMRAFWTLNVRWTSLYAFGPFEGEDSLTSLLLTERSQPCYIATLQAPYRIQGWTEVRRLKDRYGVAAVRLWILAVSNPGVLYSTNPSTISVFFDELESDWLHCSALVRDCVRNPERAGAVSSVVMRRLASRRYRERLERIADSETYLPITEWAPSARVYVCWTGGYVKPFLDRLEARLPSPRFLRVPMYSMSTETIETIPDFRYEDVAFLPIPPGVYAEFLEDESPRDPSRVLGPPQLSPGSTYELIVSDRFGLQRYCTGDVFRVERIVGGLPDLRFERRRDLAYSFTGEKLTGVQVSLAFDRLRALFPALSDDDALACFPAQPPSGGLPHYQLVVVHPGQRLAGVLPGLAARFDSLLCELNHEYGDKRGSGRLGNVRAEWLKLQDLRERMPGLSAEGLDSQFKFLPLYPRLWESPEGLLNRSL